MRVPVSDSPSTATATCATSPSSRSIPNTPPATPGATPGPAAVFTVGRTCTCVPSTEATMVTYALPTPAPHPTTCDSVSHATVGYSIDASELHQPIVNGLNWYATIGTSEVTR